jgi:hypothetical protein
MQHGGGIEHLAFTRDGKLLIVSDSDGAVRVWGRGPAVGGRSGDPTAAPLLWAPDQAHKPPDRKKAANSSRSSG